MRARALEVQRRHERARVQPTRGQSPQPVRRGASAVQMQRALGNRVMREAAAVGVREAPDSVRDALGDAGHALDDATRRYMEPRFGLDFGDVRLHTNERAAVAARSIDARAFTLGNHIAFGERQYRPNSPAGRRLLGHELAHVVQQRSAVPTIQRVCDPALLSGRTVPVFFAHEPAILDVYTGAATLGPGTTKRTAVGLVQQALVDLGFDLGTHGPRGDGVDRDFGGATESGITAFQTAEAIPGVTPGRLDEPTLRCLDEVRSHREVAAHQTATVTPSQYRVRGVRPRGRDEDLFFDRGSAALTLPTRAKIGRLATRHKGCALTLEGFISEDELVDSGPALATDRINAVDAAFAAAHHDDPGPTCTAPSPPLRTPLPHAAESSGVSDYRSRRKVEVIPPGGTSRTTPCPRGSPQFRSLSASEATRLTDAIDQGRDWLNAAIAELTAGDPEGDAALTAYFGGTSRRTTIRSNLTTWRDHLDTVVRSNNRHGTQCNAVCETAIAFNQGRGASAQMSLCPPFFRSSFRIHSLPNATKSRAFAVMHEAGHGSIGTRDTAYGHHRLIEFLSQFPTIAETNTDSYTLMVLCLNGIAALCSAPSATDTTVGLSAAEHRKARRGLGWLQTWLIWAGQDASSLYNKMNTAREAGQGVRAINTYYANVLDTLATAFDIRRPAGDPPPTFREQTTVAAIRDRLLLMQRATAPGLTIEKDTSASASTRWVMGGALGAPGRRVFLDAGYLALTTDRSRVEALLPVVLSATSAISTALESRYETFIKENVRVSRSNRP